MAIHELYRKVRETDQEVMHIYGDPKPDRELTFDKAERTFTVADGREDNGTRAVIMGILRRRQHENAWPNGGVIQH